MSLHQIAYFFVSNMRFSGILDDEEEMKACLDMAFQGGHKELITFWFGHLNKQQENSFFIPPETVKQYSWNLAHCLEVWVEEEPESKVISYHILYCIFFYFQFNGLQLAKLKKSIPLMLQPLNL